MPGNNSGNCRLLPVTPRDPGPVLLLAVLIYLLRPLSYLAVLHTVGTEKMPFDRHGFGLIGDTVILALLGIPLAWLLVHLRQHYRPGQSLFAPAATPMLTGLSFIVAFAVALPPPAQWDALRLLQLFETWPIALTGISWLIIVCLLRAMILTALSTRP